MKLYAWARRWNVPFEAINELRVELGLDGTPGDDAYAGKKSEAFADSQVVLEAGRKGIKLWRNNVGVLEDRTGRPVRYGLANESSQMNKVIKSSDRIGIRPVRIEPQHVGLVLGQFVAREIKEPGWHFTGDDHETAQLRFLELVLSMGGDAAFTTGEGSL